MKEFLLPSDFELEIHPVNSNDRLVHGTALPNTIVCLYTDDFEHITSTNDDGYWQVPIPAMFPGTEIGIQCW